MCPPYFRAHPQVRPYENIKNYTWDTTQVCRRGLQPKEVEKRCECATLKPYLFELPIYLADATGPLAPRALVGEGDGGGWEFN